MAASRLILFDAAVYMLMSGLAIWLFSAADVRSVIVGTLASLTLAYGTRKN